MMQIFRVAGYGALGMLATLTTLPSAALAQSAPTPAAPKTETFGKWSTTVDEIDTGEDLRKTCVASTACRPMAIRPLSSP
jgi:invasion protein IalB